MRKIMQTFALLLLLGLSSCINKEPYYIDKENKAIVSRNGPFHRVVIDGNNKEVSFLNYGDQKGNYTIYFNRPNPGYIVAEGFGLNKNYVLNLALGAKYSVVIYGKDNQAVKVINFKTDYHGNIVTGDD
ncbi:MAG TPA: hypothetical protein VHE59_18925 [Mucilaginibacter sp.]|nr:hypothetical protein [Mucilaginibacter sp.]